MIVDNNNIKDIYREIKNYKNNGGKWYKIIKKREKETRIKKFIFFTKKELSLHEDYRIVKVLDIHEDFGQIYIVFNFEYDYKTDKIIKYKYHNHIDFYIDSSIVIENVNDKFFEDKIKKIHLKYINIDPYGEENWDD